MFCLFACSFFFLVLFSFRNVGFFFLIQGRDGSTELAYSLNACSSPGFLGVLHPEARNPCGSQGPSPAAFRDPQNYQLNSGFPCGAWSCEAWVELPAPVDLLQLPADVFLPVFLEGRRFSLRKGELALGNPTGMSWAVAFSQFDTWIKMQSGVMTSFLCHDFLQLLDFSLSSPSCFSGLCRFR